MENRKHTRADFPLKVITTLLPNTSVQVITKDIQECEGAIVNDVIMDKANRNTVGQMKRSQKIIQNTPLDLIDTGKGLKVQTDKPHLVSLGSGRLSIAVTLLPLEEGERPLSCQVVWLPSLILGVSIALFSDVQNVSSVVWWVTPSRH
ncbi:uncharacterized protein LOC144671320 isoform X2 [Cetorhinus maximus]